MNNHKQLFIGSTSTKWFFDFLIPGGILLEFGNVGF